MSTTSPSFFIVKTLLAPLHNKLNRQEEQFWFTDEWAARQARFLLALDVASEQSILTDLITDLNLPVDLPGMENNDLFTILSELDTEQYDDLVEQVCELLQADGMAQCYFKLETVTLDSLLHTGRMMLGNMQDASGLPHVTTNDERVTHLLDTIDKARSQLHANPSTPADMLFDCCANAFETLEKGAALVR